MDAVPACTEGTGLGHLKRFSLFSLVDAQGPCKLQQDARRRKDVDAILSGRLQTVLPCPQSALCEISIRPNVDLVSDLGRATLRQLFTSLRLPYVMTR